MIDRPSTRAWRRMSVALLALAQLGFTCGPGDDDPCDADRIGCVQQATFEYLTSCPVSDDLAVELGYGEDAYTALSDAVVPTIHYGLQGGQHTFVGLRVTNAALDLYDVLRVTLWMAQGGDCVAGEPQNTIPDACERDLGVRQLVLGGPLPLNVAADGAVEEHGLLLFLSRPVVGERTVLTVEVEDPCGRLGSASHTFTP